LAAARALSGEASRGLVLARIAMAAGQARRHQEAADIAAEAETAARPIASEESRESVLAEVAGAWAAAGQYEKALAIARSVTSPELKGRALAQIAETSTQAGEAHLARRVAAEACTVGEWAIAAGPVLMIEPAAFAALEDRRP
jgi:hypothetical protein